MKTSGTEFEAALSRLSQSYPNERVALWWRKSPDSEDSFVAQIGEPCGEMDQVLCLEESPDSAVKQAIEKAGERNPESKRRLRIEQLQSELAKLQAQEAVNE